MKHFFIIPLLLSLLFACQHKQTPTTFDCKCPDERVKFVKQERFPPATFKPDSVSKPIVLTEDSSFIGMWHNKINHDNFIKVLFSKNNKLYLNYHSFFMFNFSNSTFAENDFREKKYLI